MDASRCTQRPQVHPSWPKGGHGPELQLQLVNESGRAQSELGKICKGNMRGTSNSPLRCGCAFCLRSIFVTTISTNPS